MYRVLYKHFIKIFEIEYTIRSANRIGATGNNVGWKDKWGKQGTMGQIQAFLKLIIYFKKD